eukprot:evm.model.scf_2549.1 EVM.evm.TU.scf_2549.1   scf_2549:2895-12562(+)
MAASEIGRYYHNDDTDDTEEDSDEDPHVLLGKYSQTQHCGSGDDSAESAREASSAEVEDEDEWGGTAGQTCVINSEAVLSYWPENENGDDNFEIYDEIGSADITENSGEFLEEILEGYRLHHWTDRFRSIDVKAPQHLQNLTDHDLLQLQFEARNHWERECLQCLFTDTSVHTVRGRGKSSMSQNLQTAKHLLREAELGGAQWRNAKLRRACRALGLQKEDLDQEEGNVLHTIGKLLNVAASQERELVALTEKEVLERVSDGTLLRGLHQYPCKRGRWAGTLLKLKSAKLRAPCQVGESKEVHLHEARRAPAWKAEIEEHGWTTAVAAHLPGCRACGIMSTSPDEVHDMHFCDSQQHKSGDQGGIAKCKFVPVKAAALTMDDVVLHPTAYRKLAAMDELEDRDGLEAAKQFIEDYGSHAMLGTVTLGGVFGLTVSMAKGGNRNCEPADQVLPQALRAQWATVTSFGGKGVALASPRAEVGTREEQVQIGGAVVDVGVFAVGGPTWATSLPEFKLGLVGDCTMWAVVDRPCPQLVPVWELVAAKGGSSSSVARLRDAYSLLNPMPQASLLNTTYRDGVLIQSVKKILERVAADTSHYFHIKAAFSDISEVLDQHVYDTAGISGMARLILPMPEFQSLCRKVKTHFGGDANLVGQLRLLISRPAVQDAVHQGVPLDRPFADWLFRDANKLDTVGDAVAIETLEALRQLLERYEESGRPMKDLAPQLASAVSQTLDLLRDNEAYFGALLMILQNYEYSKDIRIFQYSLNRKDLQTLILDLNSPQQLLAAQSYVGELRKEDLQGVEKAVVEALLPEPEDGSQKALSLWELLQQDMRGALPPIRLGCENIFKNLQLHKVIRRKEFATTRHIPCSGDWTGPRYQHFLHLIKLHINAMEGIEDAKESQSSGRPKAQKAPRKPCDSDSDDSSDSDSSSTSTEEEAIDTHSGVSTGGIHVTDLLLAILCASDPRLVREIYHTLTLLRVPLPFLHISPYLRQNQMVFRAHALQGVQLEWSGEGGQLQKTLIGEDTTFPLVGAIRLGGGTWGCGKTRLLKGLSGDDMFKCRGQKGTSSPSWFCAGALYAELGWTFVQRRSAEQGDAPTHGVLLANVHGDMATCNGREGVLDFLLESASVLLVVVHYHDDPELDGLRRLLRGVERREGGRRPAVAVWVCAVPSTDSSKCKSSLKALWTEFDSLTKLHKLRTSKDGEHYFADNVVGPWSKQLRRWATGREDLPPRPPLAEVGAATQDSGIMVDYIGPHCSAADRLLKTVREDSQFKTNSLRLQGHGMWMKWAQTEKQRHAPPFGRELNKFSEDCQRELTRCRDLQRNEVVAHRRTNSTTQKFLTIIASQDELERYDSLVQFQVGLGAITAPRLKALNARFVQTTAAYQEASDERREIEKKEAANELRAIAREIDAVSVDNQHFWREVGQMYESWKDTTEANKMPPSSAILGLPGLATQHLLDGFPLELMDGDARHVMLDWTIAVLRSLHRVVEGGGRVLVVSVLGVQSSGKSTLLNAMFGIQLPVGAGRCTRGVFAQLVPVEGKPYQYIMVLDTEGLRSPEHCMEGSGQKDNLMATFVFGLSDICILNVQGEKYDDLQEVITIALKCLVQLHSFEARGKRVMLANHGMAAPNASEALRKNVHKVFQEIDDMTAKVYRKLEMEGEAFKFSEIVNFDRNSDIFLFNSLFVGENRFLQKANSQYGYKAHALLNRVLDLGDGLMVDGQHHTFNWMSRRVKILWQALLRQNFVLNMKHLTEFYDALQIQRHVEPTRMELNRFCLDELGQFITKITNTTHAQLTRVEAGDAPQHDGNKFCGEWARIVDRHVATLADSLLKKLNEESLAPELCEREIESLRAQAQDLKKQAYEQINTVVQSTRKTAEINRIKQQLGRRARDLAVQLRNSKDNLAESREEQFTNFFTSQLERIKVCEDTGSEGLADEGVEEMCQREYRGHLEPENLFGEFSDLLSMIRMGELDPYKMLTKVEEAKEGVQIRGRSTMLKPREGSESKKTAASAAIQAATALVEEVSTYLKNDLMYNRDRAWCHSFYMSSSIKMTRAALRQLQDVKAEGKKRKPWKLSDRLKASFHCKVYYCVVCPLLKEAQREWNRRYNLYGCMEQAREELMALFMSALRDADDNMAAAEWMVKSLLKTLDDNFKGKVAEHFNRKCQMCPWARDTRKLMAALDIKTLESIKNGDYQYVIDRYQNSRAKLVEVCKDMIADTMHDAAFVAAVGTVWGDCTDALRSAVQAAVQAVRDGLSAGSVRDVFLEIKGQVTSKLKREYPSVLQDMINQWRVTDLEEFEGAFLRCFDDTLVLRRPEPGDEWKWHVAGDVFNKLSEVGLLGCTALCPHCRAPCSSQAGHAHRHFTIAHQPQGLIGMRFTSGMWASEGRLMTNTCPMDLMYNVAFKRDGKVYPMTEFGIAYQDWQLEPSHVTKPLEYQAADRVPRIAFTMLQDQFARYHGAKPADDIPDEWRNYDIHDVLRQLREQLME